MGGSSSKHGISDEAMDEFLALTENLSKHDVWFLKKLFDQIVAVRKDRDPLNVHSEDFQEDYITIKDFRKEDEWAKSPFFPRIFRVFTGQSIKDPKFRINSKLYMTFDAFVDMADSLHQQNALEEKVKILFYLVDRREEGMLNRDDVKRWLRDMTRGTEQLKTLEVGSTDVSTVMSWADDRDAIVARVMEEMDLDGGGEITFDEFRTIMNKNPIIQQNLSWDFRSSRIKSRKSDS